MFNRIYYKAERLPVSEGYPDKVAIRGYIYKYIHEKKKEIYFCRPVVMKDGVNMLSFFEVFNDLIIMSRNDENTIEDSDMIRHSIEELLHECTEKTDREGIPNGFPAKNREMQELLLH